MSLSPGEVQHTIRELEKKHLVRTEENFKSRSEKYLQRFCNTRYSDLQLNDAERAVVTVLLLRGPQTPGELRARSGRLHHFADNNEVLEILKRLMDHEGTPLVVELPRTPGRKDPCYMHLFSGPVDTEALAASIAAKSGTASPRTSSRDLAERVSRLEADVAQLKHQLGIDVAD